MPKQRVERVKPRKRENQPEEEEAGHGLEKRHSEHFHQTVKELELDSGGNAVLWDISSRAVTWTDQILQTACSETYVEEEFEGESLSQSGCSSPGHS